MRSLGVRLVPPVDADDRGGHGLDEARGGERAAVVIARPVTVAATRRFRPRARPRRRRRRARRREVARGHRAPRPQRCETRPRPSPPSGFRDALGQRARIAVADQRRPAVGEDHVGGDGDDADAVEHLRQLTSGGLGIGRRDRHDDDVAARRRSVGVAQAQHVGTDLGGGLGAAHGVARADHDGVAAGRKAAREPLPKRPVPPRIATLSIAAAYQRPGAPPMLARWR